MCFNFFTYRLRLRPVQKPEFCGRLSVIRCTTARVMSDRRRKNDLALVLRQTQKRGAAGSLGLPAAFDYERDPNQQKGSGGLGGNQPANHAPEQGTIRISR